MILLTVISKKIFTDPIYFYAKNNSLKNKFITKTILRNAMANIFLTFA